ncbi:MAG: STAS domain-containing protein, partial [Mycobacterium sp.]
EVLALVPTELIVDLTLVDFISSRGMYVLLKSHDQCSPSSRLIVIAEGPTTLRPMRVMGLTEILDIRTRLDDALADVHANR